MRQLADVGAVATLGESELNLFEELDDADLEPLPGGGRYALLRPMGYDDVNDDGVKDEDEPFVADSLEGVFYTNNAVDETDSPTGVALTAGFHRFLLDGSCNAIPTGDEECGVELGAACEEDAQCGEDEGAVCLLDKPLPGWPGGYCSITATKEGCKPEGGRLYVKGRPSGGGDELWLKACRTDAECRVQEGYYCQPLLGACFLDEPLRVEFFRNPKPSACQPYYIGATMQGEGPPPGGGDMMDMRAGDGGMQGPPEDCVPPDPRCDGMPGGGMPPKVPAAQCGAME